MDAYYAAVEVRENPSLKGKPIVVGGLPQSRGVVSTCSYEARKYGIHSGMSSHQAWNLCKKAIFIFPNFKLYKDISNQIKEIFLKYTDKIETMSLDEAYLDVTVNKINENSAIRIAENIKKDIHDKTKLTCSAGVSYNKFLAKIASELHKPNGLVVITPDNLNEIMFNLPIEKFHGVGNITAAKMKQLNIYTGRDLYQIELKILIKLFGKLGSYLYDVVRGIDEREVVSYSPPKSISCESTFDKDINNIRDLMPEIAKLCERLSVRMQQQNILGIILFIKIKYDNFDTVTKSYTLPKFTNNYEYILDNSQKLFLNNILTKRKIRLIGFGFHKLDIKEENIQLEMIMNCT